MLSSDTWSIFSGEAIMTPLLIDTGRVRKLAPWIAGFFETGRQIVQNRRRPGRARDLH
jgi:hypothetical protein